MPGKVYSFAILLGALSVIAVPVLQRRSFIGEGTYYTPSLGSCGIQNTDADYIVAVSELLYDSFPGHTDNPNLNPICNRKIIASYGGKSVNVTVTDKCGGCRGMYDLDFTMTAIKDIVDDPIALGRIPGIEWDWVDAVPTA
ncbi:hypothetical protein CYLTODRAFT_365455 [Cylindrobasidium torrendii FP15055 ss-10]|uniref:RlpA-like protein double-psi beta-barrel domain-containing protein n=1 Tax=Cylindrobasidium torrendii FP15055 ss-10 TaxID=1314674 RepID=A0A0D7BTH2_9AGAR|nr:hypothetical protein CYLTODRAFT_365455 [Cylindrobasidium torrendii FP15055 ss-10]